MIFKLGVATRGKNEDARNCLNTLLVLTRPCDFFVQKFKAYYARNIFYVRESDEVAITASDSGNVSLNTEEIFSQLETSNADSLAQQWSESLGHIGPGVYLFELSQDCSQISEENFYLVFDYESGYKIYKDENVKPMYKAFRTALILGLFSVPSFEKYILENSNEFLLRKVNSPRTARRLALQSAKDQCSDTKVAKREEIWDAQSAQYHDHLH